MAPQDHASALRPAVGGWADLSFFQTHWPEIEAKLAQESSHSQTLSEKVKELNGKLKESEEKLESEIQFCWNRHAVKLGEEEGKNKER